MATFLNLLLLIAVLALTKFSGLSAEFHDGQRKKSAIKVTRSVMPANFLESGPEAWDKKIGDQRNWDDHLDMKRNWDDLSSWGKRNGFDTNAIANEFGSSIKRALNSNNLKGSSLDSVELKKRWDNLQAWGKRNLNSKGNDNAENDINCGWSCLAAAYGKKVKRDHYVKLTDGSWLKVNTGRMGDDDKRGDGWDALNAWGKRSALQHKIRSRNWDSLQAWGKRESPSADSSLYENKQVIGQLQKRSAGKIL